MLSDADHIKELELDNERLQNEVERYRNACYDALQQLSWCIGWFSGARKDGHAQALSHNVAFIRRSVLNRSPEPLPPAQNAGQGHARSTSSLSS